MAGRSYRARHLIGHGYGRFHFQLITMVFLKKFPQDSFSYGIYEPQTLGI
jgi:hypothetical protein